MCVCKKKCSRFRLNFRRHLIVIHQQVCVCVCVCVSLRFLYFKRTSHEPCRGGDGEDELKVMRLITHTHARACAHAHTPINKHGYNKSDPAVFCPCQVSNVANCSPLISQTLPASLLHMSVKIRMLWLRCTICYHIFHLSSLFLISIEQCTKHSSSSYSFLPGANR